MPPHLSASPRVRPRPHVAAVLFDRDGTLVHDVPYNGDPQLVQPVTGARAAVASLRAAGVAVAVISNQSGVARGLLTPQAVTAVNQRVDELIGPFDDWQVCPHEAADRCRCRKPAPGMVQAAAAALAVPVSQCAVIGDIGSDVEAGRAAGTAINILVPTAVTDPVEVAAAECVAADLLDAVEQLRARCTLPRELPTAFPAPTVPA